MPPQSSGEYSRRRAVKALGVAGIAGVAGCIGGSDSSGDGTSTDGTTSGDSSGDGTSTDGTTSGGGSGDGTTFTFWNVIHGQSDVASQFLQTVKQGYEDETGNTVNLVNENTSAIQNGNWLTRMNQGKNPTLLQTAASRTGSFIDNGFITPWDEVLDQMDDSVVSGTEWAHDVTRNVYAGFEGEKMWCPPIGFVMQEPFVARADHFDEAGLDIESDFPPTNYDELIELATTLQQDGPGDYGFQVHGSPGDLMDEITPTWAHAYGETDGLYVNLDWTDTNLDSEAWKTSLRRQVDLYRNKDLSAPNSDTTSDEDACQLLIDGKASMSQVGMLNYGLFANRAPDMLESGQLRFARSWEGEAGFRGEFNMTSIGIGTKPPNMADSTWQKKMNAAVQFVNHIMSVDVQKEVFSKWGLLPFNQNAWEEIPPKENELVEAAQAIAEGSEYGWQAHPQMSDIQYNIPGPIFQRAMTGSISPEEACDQAAQQIRRQVFR